MSETKFTPGPHKAERISGTSGQYLITDGKKHLALVPSGTNAMLYAAAPDMYKALEHALSDMDTVDGLCKIAGVHEFTMMRAEIENVLKKARGET